MPHKSYISPSGEAYPSVTEVLSHQPKPWLEKWKHKWGILADRKTQYANIVGASFHAWAEDLIHNDDVQLGISRRLDKMLTNFEAWRQKADFKVKDSEYHVVSHLYKYAGTLDATGFLGDKPRTLALLDWKTSSGIYPDMALQLSAYAQAYLEQTGLEAKRGIIVHVSKDKPNHSLTVKEYKLNKSLFKKFLNRLKAFNEAEA